MAGRRSYGSYNDGCASAHALDLIGERWALIVVRELLLGPKRYADLQRDILGIGPAVLSQRLKGLEEAGVLVQRELPPPAAGRVYELTPWGSGLEAVNAALSQWAVGSPRMPFDADMSPDTLVLAMRAHARPVAGADQERLVMLSLTDSRVADARPVDYLATLAPAGTTVDRHPPPDRTVAACVTASTRAWKACIIAGTSLAQSVGVRVDGDPDAVETLLAATRLQHPEDPQR